MKKNKKEKDKSSKSKKLSLHKIKFNLDLIALSSLGTKWKVVRISSEIAVVWVSSSTLPIRYQKWVLGGKHKIKKNEV